MSSLIGIFQWPWWWIDARFVFARQPSTLLERLQTQELKMLLQRRDQAQLHSDHFVGHAMLVMVISVSLNFSAAM